MSRDGKDMLDARQLRICIVSPVHPPADPRVFFRHAVGLAQRGWAVTMFAPVAESREFHRVSQIPTCSSQRRIVRMLASQTLGLRLIRHKADIYHFPDVETLPVALFLQMALRRRVVYDAHEDMPSFLMQKAYLPGWVARFASKAVDLIERFAASRLSALVFADPATCRRLSPAPDRSMIFYNYPLRAFFADVPPPLSARPFDIVLAGTMSETSGFADVIRMMDQLWSAGRRVRLLLVGDPVPKLRLQVEAVAARHAATDCLDITGRIPHEEVSERIRSARIGLVPLPDLPKFHHNIATKFFEYLACGCGVLATDLPPIRPFFDAARHGRLVPPRSPEAWAVAVCGMLADTSELEAIGQAAREDFLSKYCGEHQQDELDRFYRRLL